MAIIRVTLGNRAAENVDISSITGSGPWTVTLAAPPTSDTVIGDTLTDEAAAPNSYLITGISGSDLTVRDAFGVGVAPSSAAASQATTVRSYAHPVAANADADDGGIYAVGDVAEWAVCEKINVTALQTISGGGTIGLSKIRVTGHESYRHDGTIGATGIIERATDPNGGIFDITTGVDFETSWLVLAKLPPGGTTNNSGACVKLSNAASVLTVHHNIMYSTAHAAVNGAGLAGVQIAVGSNAEFHIHNNVIYGFSNSTANNGFGIYASADISTSSTAYNNTVYGCYRENLYQQPSTNKTTASNNISMDSTTGSFSTGFSVSSNNNYASDTTAPGGLSLQSQVSADTFVNHASNDFHLKPTAAARGAGANLTGTVTGIETDIDGESRPASPTAWDIGADWYVAAPILGTPCVPEPVGRSFGF